MVYVKLRGEAPFVDREVAHGNQLNRSDDLVCCRRMQSRAIATRHVSRTVPVHVRSSLYNVSEGRHLEQRQECQTLLATGRMAHQSFPVGENCRVGIAA